MEVDSGARGHVLWCSKISCLTHEKDDVEGREKIELVLFYGEERLENNFYAKIYFLMIKICQSFSCEIS